MTFDNFDEWFKAQEYEQADSAGFVCLMRRAWEAGWEAGKLYEQIAENDRKGELGA